jgi:hypothetical protein
VTAFFGIVLFVLLVSFAAAFIFAQRVGKTTTQVVILTITFGGVFFVALCGITVAGCIAIVSVSG